METIITREYLREHPSEIFVFGDNTARTGTGGAAALRDEPNTYGFITKKFPTNWNSSFYTPEIYERIFRGELSRLKFEITGNPDKTYLISKLGAGLANRFNIWEKVIRDGLRELEKYPNVRFLYDYEDVTE